MLDGGWMDECKTVDEWTDVGCWINGWQMVRRGTLSPAVIQMTMVYMALTFKIYALGMSYHS